MIENHILGRLRYCKTGSSKIDFIHRVDKADSNIILLYHTCKYINIYTQTIDYIVIIISRLYDRMISGLIRLVSQVFKNKQTG